MLEETGKNREAGKKRSQKKGKEGEKKSVLSHST